MDFHTPPDYHAQAEKCMECAERATDRETELHWLSMAQAYLALAGALENENPEDVWSGPPHPSLSQTVSATRH
jgi:hypothetical protein